MSTALPVDRLLTIIRTQNEIAATALDVDAAMSLILERAQEVTGAEAAVVELEDDDEMVCYAASGTAERFIGVRLPVESSLSGRCVREGRILRRSDAENDDRANSDECRVVGARSLVCVPLRHSGRIVGVLKAYDRLPKPFSQTDVETLELLSGVIAAHMAHAAGSQLHRHGGRYDALTGLPNRRAFGERLDAELARARRHGGQLGLCLLDLDRFKEVNDTYGHAAGDAVLRAVGMHLAGLREEDSAYRLGGDEFAVILVGTSADGAAAAVGRVEAAIAQDPGCRSVDASWGIAGLRFGDDAASLLARADEALHEAKRPLAA